MNDWINTIKMLGAAWGLRLLGAVAILVIGRWLVKRLSLLVDRLLTRSRVDATLVAFSRNLSYAAGLLFVILATLKQLGLDTASLVAVVGAVGLAVGLALQGSLSNFASGLLLILFKPFRVGDAIEGGGVAGAVREIGIFTTRLVSADNKLIVVPNAKLTGDTIVNATAHGTRRVDILLRVDYGQDLAGLRRTILAVLGAEARVLRDPPPEVAVQQLAETGVSLAVRAWVRTADHAGVQASVQETLLSRFEQEHIKLAQAPRLVQLPPA